MPNIETNFKPDKYKENDLAQPSDLAQQKESVKQKEMLELSQKEFDEWIKEQAEYVKRRKEIQEWHDKVLQKYNQQLTELQNADVDPSEIELVKAEMLNTLDEQKRQLEQKLENRLKTFLQKQSKKIIGILLAGGIAAGIFASAVMHSEHQAVNQIEARLQAAKDDNEWRARQNREAEQAKQSQRQEEIAEIKEKIEKIRTRDFYMPYEYTKENMPIIMDKLDKLMNLVPSDWLPPELVNFANTYGTNSDPENVALAIKAAEEIDTNRAQAIEAYSDDAIRCEGWENCPDREALLRVAKTMSALPMEWTRTGTKEINFFRKIDDGGTLGQMRNGIGSDQGIVEFSLKGVESQRSPFSETVSHEISHSASANRNDFLPLGDNVEWWTDWNNLIDQGGITSLEFNQRCARWKQKAENAKENYKKQIEEAKQRNLENANQSAFTMQKAEEANKSNDQNIEGNNKRQDKILRCTQIKELFAETVEEYFFDPDSPELTQPHKQMMDKWLRIMAPGFDVKKAKIIRELDAENRWETVYKAYQDNPNSINLTSEQKESCKWWSGYNNDKHSETLIGRFEINGRTLALVMGNAKS